MIELIAVPFDGMGRDGAQATRRPRYAPPG